MITSAKVWAAAQLLKWSGKARQATALVNGFKAFRAQNTPGYEHCQRAAQTEAAAVQFAFTLLRHVDCELCTEFGQGPSRSSPKFTQLACTCSCHPCRYARSIVSSVDNARELEASLVAGERDDWRCVWEQGPGMCWEDYGSTALTGRAGLELYVCYLACWARTGALLQWRVGVHT